MPRTLPFDQQLRNAARDCGLSQAELARKLDVERSVVSRFLGGKFMLQTATLNKLAKLLGLEVVAPKRIRQ